MRYRRLLVNPEDPDYLDRRLRVVSILVGVIFAVLFLKLFFLQIIKGPYYRKLALKRSLRVFPLAAPRGNIYDRRGILLAGNSPSFTLALDPQTVRGEQGDKVLKKLASLMGEPFPSLKQRYLIARRESRNQVLLAFNLDRDVVAKIEARRFFLPGVEILVEPTRYYPFGAKAFHLIGYVSRLNSSELKRLSKEGFSAQDFLGRVGLEALFDKELRGKKGRRLVEIDARGRIRQVVAEEPPVIGKSLILTVDAFLQELADNLFQDESGAIVVMDPRDGRLLALDSHPAIDPQAFIRGFSSKEWDQIIHDIKFPLVNKALSAYPPGSTFKVVTAMAALEKGVVTPSSTIYCPGYYRLGRRTFRCWRPWGHGEVNMVKALEVSCDTYFFRVGEEIGIDFLSQTARACGLGRKTGLGFPGEMRGLVPDRHWKLRVYKEPWQRGETLNVAIGQGQISVTPLQLAKLLSAIVNGGYLYRPWCVTQILDPYGEVLEEFHPYSEGRLPAHPRTLKVIRQGLVAAVNGPNGTGKAAALPGILVGGKTGTAQIVGMKKRIHSKDLPYLRRDHAWFMAFAPADNPEVVVVVFVEHGGHGGSAAAPLAGKFLKAYFKGEHPS